MFSITEVIEIIKAVEQSSIQHFELEQQSARLVISRQNAPAVSLREAAPEKVSVQPASPLQEQEKTVGITDNLHEILAPMIGTFYCAAEPGGEPLVKIGQMVSDGTVVCVLEAMKLFNEIEAGVNGEIIEVLAGNGEFVEYGQPLFLVKKS